MRRRESVQKSCFLPAIYRRVDGLIGYRGAGFEDCLSHGPYGMLNFLHEHIKCHYFDRAFSMFRFKI